MDLQGFPYLPVNVDVGGYGPGHRSNHKLLQLCLQRRKHISNMAPGAMPWPRFAKLDYLFVSWFLFESTPFKWFNMLYYRFFSPLQGLSASNWTRPISELLLLSGPLLLLFSPSSVLPRGFSNLDRSNLKAPGLIRQLHFLEDSGLCLSLPFKLRFQISSQSMFIRPLFHWSGSITCPSILLAAS